MSKSIYDGLTQPEKVAKYLTRNKTIDRPRAISILGIWNLTAVVSDMREMGYPIQTVLNKDRLTGKKMKTCVYTMGEGEG